PRRSRHCGAAFELIPAFARYAPASPAGPSPPPNPPHLRGKVRVAAEMGADLRLRAVVALDNPNIRNCAALPQGGRMLIIRRTITRKCRLVVRKLDHHESSTTRALQGLVTAGADHVARAKFAERRLVCCHIVLVAFRIGDLDLCQPISLCHLFLAISGHCREA